MGKGFTTVIEADTAAELQAKVISLAGVMGADAPVAPQAVNIAKQEGAKRGPGRPKKEGPPPAAEEAEEPTSPEDDANAPPPEEEPAKEAETAAEVDPFSDDDEEEAPEEKPKKKLTFDDIKKALQGVVEASAGDMKAAKAILAKFQSKKGTPVIKITEVREADYPAFVAACDKVVSK